jgi:WD40 repeat protein
MWSLDLSGNSLDTSCGFCIGTLAGHDNFIYTLAVLPNGDIVSGGEDRTVRVWHDGKFSLPTHLTHLSTLKRCRSRHTTSLWTSLWTTVCAYPYLIPHLPHSTVCPYVQYRFT